MTFCTRSYLGSMARSRSDMCKRILHLQSPNDVHHPRNHSPHPIPRKLKRLLNLKNHSEPRSRHREIKEQKSRRNLSNNIPASIGILPMPQIPRHIFDHCLECLVQTTMYQAPDIPDSCAEGEDVLPLSWSYSSHR
jgi:hypothetical protein